MPYHRKVKEQSEWEFWPQQTPHTKHPNDLTTHLFIPTKDQIEFLSRQPPHCFCKKPAYTGYTLEYGPILECFSYGNTDQDIYTCGFHVHELSWKNFTKDIKHKQIISSQFPELISCPLYNFTFCSLFDITNRFDIFAPGILPDCFCNHPIKLRDNQGSPGLYFSCANSFTEGIKKCCWRLEAKNVAFKKPKYRLHTYVDLKSYQRNFDQKMLLIKQLNKLKNPVCISSSIVDIQVDAMSYFKETTAQFLMDLDKAVETVKEKSENVSKLIVQEKLSNTRLDTNKIVIKED